MSGIFGNSSEDRHFNSQLNSWLASGIGADSTSDKALEMAEAAVIDPTSEFYYLRSANMSEAITELVDKVQFASELAAMVAAENLDTTKFVSAAVKKYWIEYAKQKFEDDLFEDSLN